MLCIDREPANRVVVVAAACGLYTFDSREREHMLASEFSSTESADLLISLCDERTAARESARGIEGGGGGKRSRKVPGDF